MLRCGDFTEVDWDGSDEASMHVVLSDTHFYGHLFHGSQGQAGVDLPNGHSCQCSASQKHANVDRGGLNYRARCYEHAHYLHKTQPS